MLAHPGQKADYAPEVKQSIASMVRKMSEKTEMQLDEFAYENLSLVIFTYIPLLQWEIPPFFQHL